MNFLKTLAKTALLAAAMFGSTSAFAQWQGTWKTTYGQLKLQQNERYVFGDYGTWGTIEGLVSENKRTMRGIYRRNDDGSSGFFEWRLGGTTQFAGRWNRPNKAFLKWNSGGTSWTGNLTSSAKPALNVYRGNSSIAGFMATQSVEYVNWIRTFDNPSAALLAQDKPKEHPLSSRIPMFRGYPSTFKPRYFEVHLSRISSVTEATEDEIYGLAGIYATCELPSRNYSLTPFGGRKNQVLNVTRQNAIKGRIELNKNVGALRFPIDEACLANRDGRIAIQVQTNLKERDLRPALDDKWGYKPFKVYLDQIKDGAQFCCEPSLSIAKDRTFWRVGGRLGDPGGPGEPLMVQVGWVYFDVSFVE